MLLFSQVLSHLFPALQHVITANSKSLDEGDLCYPTDIFFTDVLAVPPPKSRPCLFAAGTLTIHPQSTGLQHVVETATTLRELLRVLRSGQGMDMEGLTPEAKAMIQATRGDKLESKVDAVWKELQGDVDHVLDRNLNSDVASASKKIGYGFKQLIERKTGIFRMHMMGKRVNFAARTVITPDPNIDVDEIGLPEVFAKNLSYR